MLTRHPNSYECELDGCFIIFQADVEEYFRLEGVASHIWKLLEGPISLDDVIGALVSMFEVDVSVCRPSTENFISELIRAQLVVSS